MRHLTIMLLAVAGAALWLAACSKGGDSASVPSCNGYQFNGYYYTDGYGNRVNCSAGYVGANDCLNYSYGYPGYGGGGYNTPINGYGNGGYFNQYGAPVNCTNSIINGGTILPGNISGYPGYVGGGYYNGCSVYNSIGVYYPVNLPGYGLVCMGQSYISPYINTGLYGNGSVIDACRVGVSSCSCKSFFGGTIGFGFCAY